MIKMILCIDGCKCKRLFHGVSAFLVTPDKNLSREYFIFAAQGRSPEGLAGVGSDILVGSRSAFYIVYMSVEHILRVLHNIVAVHNRSEELMVSL